MTPNMPDGVCATLALTRWDLELMLQDQHPFLRLRLPGGQAIEQSNRALLEQLVGSVDAMAVKLSDYRTAMDALAAEVAKNGDAVASAVTAFNGLEAHLAEVELQLQDPDVIPQDVADQVGNLRTALGESTTKLANAVLAGTPAQGAAEGGPTPPTPPPAPAAPSATAAPVE